MKTLIKQLLEITGPSGYEEKVRDYILAKIEPHVDSFKVDRLGNLIAVKGEKTSNGKTIMLTAHMDEAGVIVTHIDENGYARFAPIGSVAPRNTVGARVRFLKGGFLGVIGMEPGGDANKVPNINKMFIDLGVNSAKECPIEIGDIASFEHNTAYLGDRIIAISLVDRVDIAILIAFLELAHQGPNQIVAVFTTQQVVGSRGAGVAAYGVNPDLAVVLGAASTGDTPNALSKEIKLGQGPAIKIKDADMFADPKVVRWMELAAKKNKLPYQKEVSLENANDAKVIQLTREGVPTGCLSIPCRYMHTPSEMVDLKDAETALSLLTEMLQKEILLK